MAFNAGTAFLQVVPSFRGVQQAILSEAQKWGLEAGKTFADAFNKVVTDSTKNAPLGPSDPSTRRQGDKSGGSFADAFRRRVEAALKALPPAQIGAATTAAEQKIKDLRAELLELSGKTVGVDIGDTEALAKLKGIRDDLDRLGAQTASVQVKADIAAASAQLAAVQAEIDKVPRKVDVKVDVDDSARSKVDTLGSALIGLAPAAVPAGAAAAGAVAAVGLAGIESVAGIVVLTLGLHGVAAAVEALSKQQQTAGVTASGLASRQLAIASASDQVKSSIAALAQARANATSGEIQAAEQVKSAEQTLAAAQAAEKTAQQSLTQARVDARQALQDLNLQVQDGALAQRQANLDVANDKAQLDATLANPKATILQRQQAQLTYDQAVQQVTDLGVRQKRLIDQQQAATRAGIDGSSQVVAANANIKQSTDQVTQAQQALGDARRAQADQSRQAAASIAQAQQGVISAERALKQASDSAAAASVASSAAVDTAFSKLSPTGQRFATFIHSLGGEVSDLQHTAEDGLLPGVQAGIEALLPFEPRLKSFIAGVSGEIGELVKQDAQALTSPFFQRFFGFVATEAAPSLAGLNRVVTNLGTALAGVVLAGAPLEHQFAGGLITFTDRLSIAAQHLQDNPAFQEFLADAQQEGPEVARTVGEIAEAIGHLAAAARPIGDAEIKLIGDLAHVVAQLPTGLLTAFVVAVVALNLGLKGYNAVISISTAASKGWALITGGINGAIQRQATAAGTAAGPTNALAAAQRGATASADDLTAGLRALAAALAPVHSDAQLLAPTMSDLATKTSVDAASARDAAGANDLLAISLEGTALKADLAGTATEGLTEKEVAAKTAAGGVKTGLSNVASFLTGPWGVAIGIGATLLGGFLLSSDDTSEHVQGLSDSLGTLADAYRNLGAVGHQSIDQIVAGDANLQQAIITASQNGISVNDIGNALTGNANQAQQVVSDLDARAAALRAQVKAANEAAIVAAGNVITGDNTQPEADAARQRVTDLQAQLDKVNDLRPALTDAIGKQQQLNQANRLLATSTSELTPTQLALATAYTAVTDSSATASDKINALKAAEDALNGTAATAAENSEKFQAGLDNLTGSVKANGKSLSDHNAAGRANIDVIKAEIQTAQDQYNQAVAAANGNAAAIAKATSTYNDQVAAIKENTKQAGLNQKAVQGIVDTFGKIPKFPPITFDSTGFAKVNDQFNALIIKEIASDRKVSLSTARTIYNQQHPNLLLANAEGGLIRGPGTKTSDSILSLVSDWEYIQPAHAVDFYGLRSMEAIRAHAIPPQLMKWLAGGGRPPGFADGGLAQVGASVPRDVTYTAPSPIAVSSNQWASIVDGIRSSRGRLGRPEAAVKIDHFHAAPQHSPQRVADSIMWTLTARGG